MTISVPGFIDNAISLIIFHYTKRVKKLAICLGTITQHDKDLHVHAVITSLFIVITLLLNLFLQACALPPTKSSREIDSLHLN